MGVKLGPRQNGDGPESSAGHHESASGSGAPAAGSRALERNGLRRKGMEKSILDDIMGDPEDFKDFADSDAGSESDGGRWEDAVRAALKNEDAAIGARRQEQKGTENRIKSSGERGSKKVEASSDRLPKDGSHAPSSSSGDHGLLNGRNSPRANHGRGSYVPSANGTSGRRKEYERRYFIIKSLNHHNIAKSIENGIWATQAMNEPVLNEAFETANRVILVFSVNMSGHFQGYAQMVSPIGRRRANVWSEANDGANPWGGSFSVEWLRLYDLPFLKTVHLKNPLNCMKPVKISRDCQELTEELGDALCALIDEGADREGRPKRKLDGPDTNFQGSKRALLEPMGGHPDMPHRPRLPPPTGSGVRLPMMYGGPPLPPGVPHDPYMLPGSGNRPMSNHASKSLHPEPVRLSKSRSPHPTSSEKAEDRERDRDKDREQEKPRPPERNGEKGRSRNGNGSKVAGVDDLLEMTYEEYLQRHGHAREYGGFQQGGRFPGYPPAGAYGRGWMGGGPRMNYSDDEYVNYIANWYGRQGPMMGGEGFYGNHSMGYPGMRAMDPYWHGKPDDMPPPRRAPRASEVKSCGNGGPMEKSVRAPQQQH